MLRASLGTGQVEFVVFAGLCYRLSTGGGAELAVMADDVTPLAPRLARGPLYIMAPKVHDGPGPAEAGYVLLI